MARTIDNYGIEVSTRYAEDQSYFDQKLLGEARVPQQAQIDVTSPSYASEFDLLFDLGKRHARWADFPPPAGYFEQQRRLFTELTIPKLGTLDKREALIQRLTQMGKGGKAGDVVAEERAASDRETLISLLTHIQSLDQALIDINSKRSQYQKG